jgi:hypothetical protein
MRRAIPAALLLALLGAARSAASVAAAPRGRQLQDEDPNPP